MNVEESCSPASVNELGAKPSEDGSERVYFALATVDGNRLIKIGFSGFLRARINQLRCQFPDVALIGSAPGNRDTESFMHSIFRTLRRQGEWFEPKPRLVRVARFVRLMGDWPPVLAMAIAAKHGAVMAEREARLHLRDLSQRNGPNDDDAILRELGCIVEWRG